MKTVIVTGATGMIGISLVEFLLEKDINVLAIVRENSKRKKFLRLNKNLKIIECSLENYKSLNQIEINNCDTFIHLAWNGTDHETRDNIEVQNTNIDYTIDAIKLAKKFGCKTFIGAGSQAEYGIVNKIISENDKTDPVLAYGKAKLEAYNKGKILANELKINFIWPRIFSCYGPYDNYFTMIMQSIQTMIEKNISPDYTKAEQLWDYIYSKDVAKAYYLLGIFGKNKEIYNIAQGENKPLIEYIKIIREQINPNIVLKVGKIPYRDNQTMSLRVSIDKLKNDTGFYPSYNFQDGIAETINWYKKGGIYEKN